MHSFWKVKPKTWSSISKCMLSSPQNMSNLIQNLELADLEGFEVLRAPIGREAHHSKGLSKRYEKTEPLLDRYHQLDDSHAAYGILKICIGTPKMLYSLRTFKPSPSITKVLLHYDKAQRDCLETLTKGNVTCSIWKQANLPIKLGGWV